MLLGYVKLLVTDICLVQIKQFKEKKSFVNFCHSRWRLNNVACGYRGFSCSYVKRLAVAGKVSDGTIDKRNEVCLLLKKHNVDDSHIARNPWLLHIHPETLSTNYNLIKNLNLDPESSIPLLSMSYPKLNKLVAACKRDKEVSKSNEDRILFLSRMLKQKPSAICEALAKYSFSASMSLRKIKKIVDVLVVKHNLSSEEILNDFWVFQYKPESINARLEEAQEGGVKHLKPWMGRCREKIFNRTLERLSTRNQVLGNATLEVYLSKRLGCSEEYWKTMLEREPQLKQTNVVKIKEIIDFLLANNVTPRQISPALLRVVKRKKETLGARLEELNALGCSPKTVYALGMSEREYGKYIQSIKGRGKSKRKNSIQD